MINLKYLLSSIESSNPGDNFSKNRDKQDGFKKLVLILPKVEGLPGDPQSDYLPALDEYNFLKIRKADIIEVLNKNIRNAVKEVALTDIRKLFIKEARMVLNNEDKKKIHRNSRKKRKKFGDKIS